MDFAALPLWELPRPGYNLPALVCDQCGEVYYSPEADDRVVELISSGKEPIRTEAVPVLDAR